MKTGLQIKRLAFALAVIVGVFASAAALADDSTTTSSTSSSTSSISSTYSSIFSSCITCAPTTAAVTQGFTLSQTFFASYAPFFGYLVSAGLALYLCSVAFRMYWAGGREQLAKEFVPTIWKAGTVAILLGGGSIAPADAYSLVTTTLWLPTLTTPLTIASDILANDVPTTAVTANSHAACQKVSSSTILSSLGTADGLTGPVNCVVYTAEESASWIITIGMASIGSEGTSTGIVGTVTSIADKAVRLANSPISFISDCILILVAARAFLTVAVKLMVNYAGFCIAVFFLPVALFLWVLPPTKGALRYYLAVLAEHGIYFIGLAVISAVVPTLASAVLSEAGYSGVGSVTDLFNKVNSFGSNLSVFSKTYWILIFLSGAQGVLYSVPENLARRMSAMISQGS